MVKRKTPVERFEEFDITNQDGVEFHVKRNLDTGEQEVHEIDASSESVDTQPELVEETPTASEGE